MTTSLVLRVTDKDGRSYGGFQWPMTVGTEVIAPNWEPTAECGNGLHGWLYGNGYHSVATIDNDSKWFVVEVLTSTIINLDGKCKFPRCTVCFVGDRKSAADYLIAHESRAQCVIGANLTVGDKQSCSVGALGYAQGGDRATVTGGDRATVTGGNWATVTGGDRATVTGGDRAELQLRYWDFIANRYRTKLGYIGENGLLPNTRYKLNDKQEFEPC